MGWWLSTINSYGILYLLILGAIDRHFKKLTSKPQMLLSRIILTSLVWGQTLVFTWAKHWAPFGCLVGLLLFDLFQFITMACRYYNSIPNDVSCLRLLAASITCWLEIVCRQCLCSKLSLGGLSLSSMSSCLTHLHPKYKIKMTLTQQIEYIVWRNAPTLV